MEKKSKKKKFILDSSAFISLESIDLLNKVIDLFSIITTNSVITELEDFSQYEDKYGRISKRVLKLKNKLIIKSSDITEKIKYLEDTDNELFNLSKKIRIPLITDDHKIVHHTKDKTEVLFSTVFLAIFVGADILTKKDALEKLEQLRDIRNWKNNIIYLDSKKELESIK